MTGKAVGLKMNYGYAGAVSRTPDCVIEAKPVKSTSAAIPFGTPAVLNTDNTVSHPSSVALTAANFVGIAANIVKQYTSYPSSSDNVAGQYEPEQAASLIKRGDVTVKVAYGTPTAGGAVYVRTVLNGSFPTEAVGDFRTAADSSNTVQLTNCCWKTGHKDANGIAELTIKSINN